jgi:hypothetical protein
LIRRIRFLLMHCALNAVGVGQTEYPHPKSIVAAKNLNSGSEVNMVMRVGWKTLEVWSSDLFLARRLLGIDQPLPVDYYRIPTSS